MSRRMMGVDRRSRARCRRDVRPRSVRARRGRPGGRRRADGRRDRRPRRASSRGPRPRISARRRRRQRVPEKVRSEGAITDLDEVKGLVTATDLVAGEVLLKDRFASPGQVTKGVGEVKVPRGSMEVTLSLEPQKAVGGLIKPGDRVVVIGTPGSSASDAGLPAGVLAHQVLVTNVQIEDRTGEPSRDDDPDGGPDQEPPRHPRVRRRLRGQGPGLRGGRRRLAGCRAGEPRGEHLVVSRLVLATETPPSRHGSEAPSTASSTATSATGGRASFGETRRGPSPSCCRTVPKSSHSARGCRATPPWNSPGRWITSTRRSESSWSPTRHRPPQVGLAGGCTRCDRPRCRRTRAARRPRARARIGQPAPVDPRQPQRAGGFDDTGHHRAVPQGRGGQDHAGDEPRRRPRGSCTGACRPRRFRPPVRRRRQCPSPDARSHGERRGATRRRWTPRRSRSFSLLTAASCSRSAHRTHPWRPMTSKPPISSGCSTCSSRRSTTW